MKTIYLLRHAKSNWSDHGLSDKERPLSARGLRDAPEMAGRFAARGESLDRVLTSPATRALTTAQLFCASCDYPQQAIEVHSELYFSGGSAIEDLIRSRADGDRSLMLVFHNPDITQFVNSIDYELRIDNVPTCGLIRLDCDIAQWRDWDRGNTRFEYFDFPKNLQDKPLGRD